MRGLSVFAFFISSIFSLISRFSSFSFTGTFIKHPQTTWWGQGLDGIPNGWTIVNAWSFSYKKIFLRTGGFFSSRSLFIEDSNQKWERLPARCSITR